MDTLSTCQWQLACLNDSSDKLVTAAGSATTALKMREVGTGYMYICQLWHGVGRSTWLCCCAVVVRRMSSTWRRDARTTGKRVTAARLDSRQSEKLNPTGSGTWVLCFA